LSKQEDWRGREVGAVRERRVLGEAPEQEQIRRQQQQALLAFDPQLTQQERTAQTFLGQTAAGQFLDPFQQPAFQALAAGIQRQGLEAGQAQSDLLRSQFARAGQSFSSPLLAAQGRLGQRVSQDITQQISQQALPFIQQAQQQRFAAAPLLQQFGGLERQFPLQQIQAQQQARQLAGIPIGFQQQQEDESINFLQRQRDAQLEPLRNILALLQGIPGAENIAIPSAFERIGVPLLAGTIQAGGAALGGQLSKPG